MYYTKGLYEKRALFNNEDDFSFFIKALALANKQYREGVRLAKKNQLVVYGSTIQDFNPEFDGNIARIEMNDRGLLRSFIGVDWDLDDVNVYQQVKQSLQTFSKTYHTPVLFYPTFSYPTKPHFRSVCFTEEPLNGDTYPCAVTWLEETLGAKAGDDGNYSIKHNFNAPSFNSEEAFQEATWFSEGERIPQQQMTFQEVKQTLEQNKMFLSSLLWKNTKPAVKIQYQNHRVVHYDITEVEKFALTEEELAKGEAHLLQMMDDGETFADFSKYNNFFQFLHALARAQTLGSMTQEQAHHTLYVIARGNHEYEERNIKDYHIELKRVMGDKEKLRRARPITGYFGTML